MASGEHTRSSDFNSQDADMFSSLKDLPIRTRLSISNPDPQLIDGPFLLHQLVPQAHDGLALDFARHDGSKARFTYTDLQDQSMKLANMLGCYPALAKESPQPVIPLFIPQSPELYLAMVAVLKAGCAFCPLPLDAPSERLNFIFKDVEATVVLAVTTIQEKLAAVNDVKILCVDELLDSEYEDMNCALRDVSAIDAAYVMYTSGSTGTPKGVAVSHKAATQSLLAHDKHIPLFSRFLQFAAPTFDVSMFEIFFTLYRGATLVACDRADLLNDLPGVMRQMNVDGAELTPTVAGGLLKRRELVPKLKLLLTIGEMLTPQVIKEFGGNETKESILWAMYGPTEAAIHCTLQPALSTNANVGDIGFPFDTVSALVVSSGTNDSTPADIRVLPRGEVGELAVSGHQLADGYLNRPEQTSDAFVDTKEYGRVYLTGDKARMFPDGTLECLGRIKAGQVKLRGQRIELGEIEAAALRVSECRMAAANVIQSNLVLFCQVDDENISSQTIMDACRQWLPRFMVPGDIVLCQQFPHLSSGKIDRKQLQLDYEQEVNREASASQQPVDEVVRRVCDVISGVVGRSVQPGDTLNAAGLDSLLAIQAAGRFRETGLSFSVNDLLAATTAIDLCSFSRITEPTGAPSTEQYATSGDIDNGLKSMVLNKVLESNPVVDIQDIVTCSPLQIAMLAETAKDPLMYCNWIEFEFRRPCSVEQIKGWVQELCTNNEILRSGFCEVDSTISPYAQIIWKSIEETQISQVDRLQPSFEMSGNFCLLRPIHFQICCESTNPTLLIQLHHALYDGWSVDHIVHDLALTSAGDKTPVRPQFREVTKYYDRLDNSSSYLFWQERFASFTPAPIPRFIGRQLTPVNQASKSRTLSTSMSKLRASARTLGASPQSFVQAALAYIVSSYLASSDIAIATVTSGRTLPIPGIEDIIGPCIATLPLRVNVAHARRVRDLVRLVYDRTREMLPHCALPYREIKRANGLDANVTLSDVLFIWQESLHSRAIAEVDQRVRVVDQSDQLEFKLLVEVEPRGERLCSKATFLCETLPDSQVELLLQQIDELVAVFSSDHEMELDCVTRTLSIDLLSIYNPTPELQAFDGGLASIVSSQALRAPTEIAVLFAKSIVDSQVEVESLTYQQLNTKANQLAHALLSHLGQEEKLVGVCMPKSLDLYVAILAVLKTGRGYLALAPENPKDRVHLIIRNANARTMLSIQEVSDALQLAKFGNVVTVDSFNPATASKFDPRVQIDGSDAAYYVFTSGSTGTPKGVLVTQHNLLSNLRVLSNVYPVRHQGKLLQACSQAFDVSGFEIFFAWYTGMCICTAANNILFRDLEASIRELEITHLSLTSAVAGLVHPENVPSVEFLVTAGEDVTEKVLRTWAGHGLYQGYRLSETTSICTVKPNVQEGDLINDIGQPLKNTSAFVYRPGTDELVVKGGVGELCFGGDQVFHGYLRMPSLTDQKLIHHPQYGRIYRSGDLGRLLPDGSILFSGRIDDQDKVRSQRVELGEINHALLSQSSTQNCCTLYLREPGTGSEKTVSFVVLRNSRSPTFGAVSPDETVRATLKSLSDALSRQLPSYMIPSYLVPVTELPMTDQGKIDKAKLSGFFENLSSDYLNELGHGTDGRIATEVWSSTELKLVGVVACTLQTPQPNINKHLSLFTLGLDSITAIPLARSIRESFHHEITVSTILLNPTISRLAAAMASIATQAEQTPAALSEVFTPETWYDIEAKVELLGQQDAIEALLPCTPLQEAMLSATLSAESNAYCNVMEFEIRGDPEKLLKSWANMVQKHAILRMCFVPTKQMDYPYAQVVLSTYTDRRSIINIESKSTGRDVTNDVEMLMNRVKVALQTPSPPYVLELMRFSDITVLQFVCHHALYDAAAMNQLIREIEFDYYDRILPKTTPYEPFFERVIAARSGPAIEFWTKKLEGVQPTLFKVSSSPRRRTVPSPVNTFEVPLNKVQAAAQRHQVSMLALLQAAWVKVLHTIFDRDEICFGTVFNGREGAHKLLVAPTFNTLPVRINLRRHDTNASAINELQDYNGQALKHHLVPLRVVQQRLGVSGGLFSTLFLLQQSEYELDDQIWTLKTDDGAMNIQLVMELIPRKARNALVILLHTEIPSEDLYTPQLQEAFTSALESCISYPASGIRDFKTLPEESRIHLQKYIAKSDATPTAYGATNSSISETLRTILSNIAQIPPQLFSTTTIYHIGLDSISVLQLAAHLKEKGFPIPVSEILENPKLSDLDALLLQARKPDKPLTEFDFDDFSETYHLNLSDAESVWPCTPLQMGMLAQFIHTGDSYVNAITLNLGSTWRLPSIQEAWSKVISRHAMLRTGFVQIDSPIFPFMMVTYAAGTVTEDLLVEIGKTVNNLESWRRKSAKEFLSKLRHPPWRVQLSETNGEILMHMVMFHGLYDEHSLHLILRALQYALQSRIVPKPQGFIQDVINSILVTSLPECVGQIEAPNDPAGAFWSNQLEQAPATRFPCLSPILSHSERTGHEEIVCNMDISELEKACQNGGFTVQAVGQAAWGCLLSAYVGEATVVFGTVLSGRDINPTAENVAFPTIVTVPTVVRVDNKIRTILSSLMSFNASVHRHQFSTMSAIQRWTDRVGQTLFDTVFVLQKSNPLNVQFEVVEEISTTEYSVSLELEYSANGKLLIRLSFNADVLPQAHAQLMLDQYNWILRSVVFDTATALDISGFPSPLLSISLAKKTCLPPAKDPSTGSSFNVNGLHEFVEHYARTEPNRIALEFADQIYTSDHYQGQFWTYQQLNVLGNKITGLISLSGVSQGSLVAVCFQKCPQASWAILGILKAGCAFVAIDPDAPMDRKTHIMRDSKASLVLTFGDAFGNHNSQDFTVVDLLYYSLDSMPATDPKLARPIQPEDSCYCLYTSGTTGLPKGCLIAHENAVQVMRAFSRVFEGHWDLTSKWLQFASYHFDVSVLEQYWSWSVGICVVSAPRDILLRDLTMAIKALRVTHIDLTPSLAATLRLKDLPLLCQGVFIIGGESLKQEVLNEWAPFIYNGYGPTEATIGVTMLPRVPKDARPSNIGRPFENVGAYVLCPGSNTPVLRGAVGELCVAGKLVGKGYLHRPDLTNTKFPKIQIDGSEERVYRTGDLVRLLYDGSVDFIGRADGQVKLRGQRLETGEINSVIRMAVPKVTEVETLVLKHWSQQKEQLVVFLSSEKTGMSRTTAVLRTQEVIKLCLDAVTACHSKLPGYMVPTHVIPVTSVPLTNNNKIDVNALRVTYDSLSRRDLLQLSGRDGAKSLNQTERIIAAAISQVTRVEMEDIRQSSSIFELGVDSISAIALSRALRQQGLSAAEPAVVMKNPVVESLARALESSLLKRTDTVDYSVVAAKKSIAAFAHRHLAAVSRVLGARKCDIICIAPCTPLQEGIISRSANGESGLYFNTFRLELMSDANVDGLKKAWKQLYDHIPILRTRFVPTDDGYAQVVLVSQAVLVSQDVTFPWREMIYPTERGITKQKERWVESNASAENTLLNPFQLCLVRTAGKTEIIVYLFHALYDAISLHQLLNLLYRCYKEDLSWLPSTLTFTDALPLGPLRPGVGAESFWKQYLRSKDSRSTLTFMEREEAQGSVVENREAQESVMENKEAQGSVHVCIRVQTDRELEKVRRRLNVTHQAIVQACWMTVLRNYTTGPVTIGVVVSGRNLAVDGIEEVIGPMFNTIPFQLDVHTGETWEHIIRRCHDFNIAAIPFQHTPLRQIHKWMGCFQQDQLFESLFVFQKRTETAKLSLENDLWSLTTEDVTLDYPLALQIEYSEDAKLELNLTAQAFLMDEGMARSLLQQMVSPILSMMVSPNFISTAVDTRRFQKSAANWDQNAADTAPTRATSTSSTAESSTSSYEWTTKASFIRSVIARLAAMQECDVHATASIFELGLDSIDAVKLAASLRNAGMTIAVSTVMQRPIVSDIVRNASKKHSRRTPPPVDIDAIESRFRKLLPLDLTNVERVLPCTPLQEAMLVNMFESNYQQYYNHDVLRIKPKVKLERLKQALEEVHTRESALRTAFVPLHDSEFTFAQVIWSPGELPWTELEVGSEGELSKVLEFITTDAARLPMGSAKFRLTMVQLPTSRLLVLSLPHAMYDGWSLRLLHQAVHQCYGPPSIVINASSDLIAVTLAEIVRADNPYAAEFWQGYLAKAKPCLVSADKHSTLAVGSAVHLKERKSFFTLDRIHEFCREQGVTLQALGQLCWTIVLASQTGDLEVLFGIVLSCRDTLDSQKIMFPTMNTVAFRSLVRGSRHDMLRYTQETMSSIREFQQFPLRKAQRYANVQKGKLFDTVFIFQKTPDTAAYSDQDLYKSIRTESSVEYAVCVEMEELDRGLIWRVACQGEIFTEDETDHLLSHLNDVLIDIIGDSSAESVEINGDELRFGSLPPCRLNLGAEASHSSGRQGYTLELGELNSTDKAIRSVLSEVSKIPETDISKEQTIFQLGLDSISVMKVSALLRQQSIYLSVSELVKASNIHEMARIADSHAEKQDIVSDDETLPEFDIDRLAQVLGINTNQIERVLPATAGQTYALTSWCVSEGALFYPTFEFEVTGAVSTKAMQASWAKVVDQNPILRTVFVMTDSLSVPAVQVVIRSGANATVEQPLVKLAIGPRQNDRWPLQLRIHHALYDAHSLRRLMKQFECFLRGHAEVVGEYEPFSTLVRRAYKPSATSRAKAFWTKYLNGMHTAHKLPASRFAASADVRCYTPDIVDRRYRSLPTMARYYGVGVPQLFIAVWAKLYNGMTDKHAPDGTKNPDVIIGVYLANRPFATEWVEGLDEVAAPTLSLVPLRVRSPGSKGIVEIAMEIQSDLLEIGSLEVAMTNLWSIKEWTGVTVDNFVNFLPRSQDTTSNSVVSVNAIRVVDVDTHDVPVSEACSRTKGNSRESVQQSDGPVEKLFNDLGNNKIVEAYPPCVTIEAALRDNGGLDVGVFAPDTVWKLGMVELVSKVLKTDIEKAVTMYFEDQEKS